MQIVMMTDDADHLGAHVGIDQQELPESLAQQVSDILGPTSQ